MRKKQTLDCESRAYIAASMSPWVVFTPTGWVANKHGGPATATDPSICASAMASLRIHTLGLPPICPPMPAERER